MSPYSPMHQATDVWFPAVQRAAGHRTVIDYAFAAIGDLQEQRLSGGPSRQAFTPRVNL